MSGEAAVPRAPLESWLATTLPELGRIVELTQFPGGFSNLVGHYVAALDVGSAYAQEARAASWA